MSPAQRRLVDGVFVSGLVLPTLAWILMDQSVWESDPAFYGIGAVRLLDAMLVGRQEWWSAIMSLDTRPPFMSWVGQFLVPLGLLLGNIDAGLLLLNVAAQWVVLWLLHRTAMDLFGDRRLARLCVLMVASAPMFGWVSRQFLVQTVQLAVVSWYVFIMCRAAIWDRLFTVLSLAAATALAPLTMLSTPAYCCVPAALALWISFRSGPSTTGVTVRHVAMAFVTAVVLRISIPWYNLHLSDALEYARHAFGFIWAGTPGANYPARFAIWLSRLFGGLFVIPIGVGVAVAAAVALRSTRWPTGDLRHRAVVLQIPVTLAVLAGASQQEPRYILPLVGCVALSLAWLLRAAPRVQQMVTALMLTQFVLVTVDAHALIGSTSAYPHRVQREPDPRFALMDGVLSLREQGAHRVMLVLGAFELYSTQVDYYALKAPAPPDARQLTLNSGEFVYMEGKTAGNAAAVWAAIEEWNPDHIVTVNADLRRQQRALWEGSSRGWGLVMRVSADIADLVDASPRYERLPVPHAQLVFYKRRS